MSMSISWLSQLIGHFCIKIQSIFSTNQWKSDHNQNSLNNRNKCIFRSSFFLDWRPIIYENGGGGYQYRTLFRKTPPGSRKQFHK